MLENFTDLVTVNQYRRGVLGLPLPVQFSGDGGFPRA
jgi:hypothetical protein